MSNEETIEQLVTDMTPIEKIGQMTQASNEAITPGEVADLSIGSVLSGGNGNPSPNTPQVWEDMVGSFVLAGGETRLGIPLIYGVDAVHGHGNVGGATVFPHNIGLGAANDPELTRRIGAATALEMAATGVRWTFAPTVAVPQDIRWGRTYEGYGRDPRLVSALGAATIEGLQSGEYGKPPVLACAKHFVGDGGTTWGTAPRPTWVHWWDGWGDQWEIDQGDARMSESELRSMHLKPYESAVAAGAMSIMASYNSWNGEKLHSHSYLLTEVLKGELGFAGFVVSDWMGIDQLAPDYEDCVVAAVNAGIDMVMVPEEFRRFIDVMTRATKAGRIPMQRVDDAVRRILRAKLATGLFDPDPERPSLAVVGSAEHRELAAQVVRGSAVLLKNEQALPLPPSPSTIEVAGAAADDIGLQCGGWTVSWLGGSGRTTEGSTLLDGLEATFPGAVRFDPSGRFADSPTNEIGIVCVAETPYAEGLGDSALPTVTDDDRRIFSHMRARSDKLILVVYSGRPLVIADLIEQADAVIAAWLPGTEAAALADLIAGRHPIGGRTPQPWPRSKNDLADIERNPLFPTGYGIDLQLRSPSRNVEGD